MIEMSLGNDHLLAQIEMFARWVIEHRPFNEKVRRGDQGEITFHDRWMLGRKITVPTFVATRTAEINHGEVDDPTPIPSEIEQLYIHRYVQADAEDLHCHPWANGSLIITGWMAEQTEGGQTFMRHPGDIVIRAAHETHRIVDVEPGTITLFGTAPKVREWGFWPIVDGEPTFVHHTQYRAWKRARGLT